MQHINKQATEEAANCMMLNFGMDAEKAAKAHECSVDDVEDVMANRFAGIAERFGVSCGDLLEAANDLICEKMFLR